MERRMPNPLGVRRLILIGVIAALFGASYFAKRWISATPSTDRSGEAALPATQAVPYHRIVSLAPNITEILFALGLQDRLVGVTRFCNYPPEAREKTRVGGYIDPNYEAIVALKPDLVIIFPEHAQPKNHFAELGLKTLTVPHNTLQNVLDAIAVIGRTCGAEEKAQELVREIETRMNAIARKAAGRPRPTVLICVGRTWGAGKLDDVYVVGKDGFYDELVYLAGGQNAYRGAVAFPKISYEGILRMNPQIIIDIITDLAEKNLDKATARKDWQSVASVDAVKSDRVYIFGQNYAAVPGPRFILILEQLARTIHPELAWDQP